MKVNCIYKKELKNSFVTDCEIEKGNDDNFYYLYKIVFPNGNYYIGEHKTKNLYDGYGGSGALLPREYSRCDINEVKKIILGFFKNMEELSQEEKRAIGNLYETDEKCLNLMEGGSSGFSDSVFKKSSSALKGKKRSKEAIEKQRISSIGRKHSEETKRKQSLWHLNFWKSDNAEKKRENIRLAQTNRIVSEETRKKISNTKKEKANTDVYFLTKYFLYYENEILEKGLLDFYNKCLEEAKNNSLSVEDRKFFEDFFQKTRKERERKRYYEKIKDKPKYVFTEEHKKHLSESKKGRKLSEGTKKKFSEMRRGRGNSNYCSDKIEMYDEKWNYITTFKDCIEACDYIKNTVNQKAKTSEIFVATRTGRTRFNHKWKRIEEK